MPGPRDDGRGHRCADGPWEPGGGGLGGGGGRGKTGTTVMA